LVRSWLLSLGYIGNRGYHLSSNAIGRRELDPPIYIPGQSTEDNTQARRINRNFSGVGLYPTDLYSRYQSAVLLSTEPDMALVGEASNGREAIQQFRAHRPDIRLWTCKCRR